MILASLPFWIPRRVSNMVCTMDADGRNSTVTQLTADEERLIDRLQAGDEKALAAIERQYSDELRLFCRRMLNDSAAADDLVQDVLYTCCRTDAAARPTHSVRGWLYQIARRRCIDQLRRQRGPDVAAARGKRRPQPTFEHAVDPLTTPAGKALKRDRAERLLAVLDELDEDLRSVVVMRYFQDLSREEIAEAVGLTIAGTKTRLTKAMGILREKLGQLDESGS